jgi:hypothetical protein
MPLVFASCPYLTGCARLYPAVLLTFFPSPQVAVYLLCGLGEKRRSSGTCFGARRCFISPAARLASPCTVLLEAWLNSRQKKTICYRGKAAATQVTPCLRLLTQPDRRGSGVRAVQPRAERVAGGERRRVWAVCSVGAVAAHAHGTSRRGRGPPHPQAAAGEGKCLVGTAGQGADASGSAILCVEVRARLCRGAAERIHVHETNTGVKSFGILL